MPTKTGAAGDQQAEMVDALRAAIDEGIADLEAGKSKVFEAEEALRAYLRSLAKTALGR